MAELAALLNLTLKVQKGDSVLGYITGKDLDGDVLIKLGVLPQPNLPHGAPAQFLHQLIAPRANLDSRRQVTRTFQLQINVQVAHLQALTRAQAYLAAHLYVIQESAGGALEVFNEDSLLCEVQLGVLVGDILTFSVDRAIGIPANGMHAFAQEALGNNGSIVLEHQNFDTNISHGTGVE